MQDLNNFRFVIKIGKKTNIVHSTIEIDVATKRWQQAVRIYLYSVHTSSILGGHGDSKRKKVALEASLPPYEWKGLGRPVASAVVAR